jgi:hypothetical protein
MTKEQLAALMTTAASLYQGFQLTNCCGLLPRGKPDSAQEEPI